jgi:Fe-S-cluster containining protein
MKHVDEDQINELPGVRISRNDTFNFRCYPEIDCFNQCCRNLNLFLYPYDVLRLKQSLGLSSAEFLDRYVDIVMRPSNFFPDVLLRMSENAEKTCPFLFESGCRVYPDRPDSCRTFPIEQGMFYDARHQKETPIYIFRPPVFCRGQHEKKEWTIPAWTRDQEAELYHKMTIRWANLKRLFQSDPWGIEGCRGPKAKMAFMATYNIDRFRDFVFQSSFLRRYRVKSAILKKLKTDDVHMLKFGFEWVRVFVWGQNSTQIRIRQS